MTKHILWGLPFLFSVLFGSMVFGGDPEAKGKHGPPIISKDLEKIQKDLGKIKEDKGDLLEQVCREGICGSVSASQNRRGPNGCTQGKICSTQGTCTGTCTTYDNGTTCACACI